MGAVAHLVQARDPPDHWQSGDRTRARAGEHMNPWGLIGVAVMFGSLFLTPLGLPGNWIMIIVVAVGPFYGEVGVAVLLAALGLALAAEVVEFWNVMRYNLRYGGGRQGASGSPAGQGGT